MGFISTYGTVSVGTGATLILASNPERKGSLIFNNGIVTVYLGMDANVTSSTGYPLLPNASLSNSGQNEVWKGALYGITGSSSADIRFWEFGP